MKGTDHTRMVGAVIGKAHERLDHREGLITMLVVHN